jgi:hypothetical protein
VRQPAAGADHPGSAVAIARYHVESTSQQARRPHCGS